MERECGATTAYATHVVIGEPGMAATGASDLFIATRGNFHPDWGDAEARVDWTGPDRLTITYDSMSELHAQESSDGEHIGRIFVQARLGAMPSECLSEMEAISPPRRRG